MGTSRELKIPDVLWGFQNKTTALAAMFMPSLHA